MIKEFMMTKKIFNILTVLSLGLLLSSNCFAIDMVSDKAAESIKKTIKDVQLVPFVQFDKEDLGFIPYYFGNLAVDIENNVYASLDYGLSSFWDMTRPNIIKYDGNQWTINNPIDEKGESLGYVGKINIDLSGNLWASLYDREGFVISVYNGKRWLYNNPDIPIDWISEIAVDKSNTVWLGTGDGIYLIRQ